MNEQEQHRCEGCEIAQIIPAQRGWKAVYADVDTKEPIYSDIALWALLKNGDIVPIDGASGMSDATMCFNYVTSVLYPELTAEDFKNIQQQCVEHMQDVEAERAKRLGEIPQKPKATN